MPNKTSTIYLTPSYLEKMADIAADLKKNRVYGLHHEDGTVNSSALVRYLIDNYKKASKNDQ